MQGRIWTISNGLSVLRVLLVYPIVVLLSSGGGAERLYATVLIVVAVSTDFFDGLIARKMHQVSDLGKVIDPIADKIGIGAVAIVLALEGSLPLWFLLIVLVRDVLIFLGGLYIQRTKGLVLQSTFVGKWAAAAVALFILGTVVGAPWLETVNAFLLAASVCLLAISFASYARRFALLVRKRPSP